MVLTLIMSKRDRCTLLLHFVSWSKQRSHAKNTLGQYLPQCLPKSLFSNRKRLLPSRLFFWFFDRKWFTMVILCQRTLIYKHMKSHAFVWYEKLAGIMEYTISNSQIIDWLAKICHRRISNGLSANFHPTEEKSLTKTAFDKQCSFRGICLHFYAECREPRGSTIA